MPGESGQTRCPLAVEMGEVAVKMGIILFTLG